MVTMWKNNIISDRLSHQKTREVIANVGKDHGFFSSFSPLWLDSVQSFAKDDGEKMFRLGGVWSQVINLVLFLHVIDSVKVIEF